MLRNLTQRGASRKKSITAIKQKMYDKFTELLVTLWGSVETESPTYKNVEMSLLASNPDPTGILLKTHLGRYWKFASPSTNRQTYYCMKGFFDFLKYRNEPIIVWEVWPVLIFFEQRRSELLAQYGERVLKQQRLEKKRCQPGRKVTL